MPRYTFDVTEKCVDFMKNSIKDMPGNPGQEVLVEDLEYDCKFIVIVDVFEELEEIEISSEYDIHLRSNHPEAIEIIIKKAEQRGEFIGELAAVPGPWELADAIATRNWKIVGYDSGYLRTA
jgi:hypothetical protein